MVLFSLIKFTQFTVLNEQLYVPMWIFATMFVVLLDGSSASLHAWKRTKILMEPSNKGELPSSYEETPNKK